MHINAYVTDAQCTRTTKWPLDLTTLVGAVHGHTVDKWSFTTAVRWYVAFCEICVNKQTNDERPTRPRISCWLRNEPAPPSATRIEVCRRGRTVSLPGLWNTNIVPVILRRSSFWQFLQPVKIHFEPGYDHI